MKFVVKFALLFRQYPDPSPMPKREPPKGSNNVAAVAGCSPIGTYNLRMDVLYFLKERTRFIRQFYDVADGAFAEIKRRISDAEPPFDAYPPGFDPEDGEPPFLDEYSDADAGEEFVGQSAVSFVASSLKLFFDEMRHDLSRFHGGRVPEFDAKYAKNYGFFAANRRWFAEIGIDLDQSGADLAIVEEVILTRNVAQHPDSIVSMALHLRGQEVRRRPFPWFVHPFEESAVAQENLEDLQRLSWMLSITREKFLKAVDQVDVLCEFVSRRSGGEQGADE